MTGAFKIGIIGAERPHQEYVIILVKIDLFVTSL
jgi:hypothetical protein